MTKKLFGGMEIGYFGSHIAVHWNRVWSHKIPLEVKHFLWRLLKSILPTRYNLRRRGLDLDVWCPMSSKEPETVEHLFMQCDWTKRLWFVSSLGIRAPTRNCKSMSDWLAAIKEHFDAEILELWTMSCWPYGQKEIN